jgi:small subunit ribosomal protein S20
VSNNNSAKKRERQNEVRRQRNHAVKSEVRTSVKKFEKALADNDKTAAEAQMAVCFKLLDSATSKGVMPRNTTSRKKSRIYHAFSKLA